MAKAKKKICDKMIVVIKHLHDIENQQYHL